MEQDGEAVEEVEAVWRRRVNGRAQRDARLGQGFDDGHDLVGGERV